MSDVAEAYRTQDVELIRQSPGTWPVLVGRRIGGQSPDRWP